MEDAIAKGSDENVSRLADVMAEGEVQFRQWTNHLRQL